MIPVAITDDNEMLRRNLVERLSQHFQIVFEASSARSMLRYLHANPAINHPAVILMDIAMDEMDGIEATSLIKQEFPEIKVIMLTVFEENEKILNAIKAGADGYLIKDETRERMIECINDVLNGGSYMSPSVAIKAMKWLQKTYVPDQSVPGNPLSKREQEILQLIIDGCSYASIATKLFISLATVKTHISHIYQKLHVTNKMDAAKKVSARRWL